MKVCLGNRVSPSKARLTQWCPALMFISLQAVNPGRVTVPGLDWPAGSSTLCIAFFPVLQRNRVMLKLEAPKTLYKEKARSGLKRSQFIFSFTQNVF